MESLLTMISGLWSAVNDAIIFDNGFISFSIGQLLIALLLISIVVSFIHIIIRGSGDKTHQEFTIGRKE